MICPKCDGQLDAAVRSVWGEDPPQIRQPIAPFVCSLCGSLLLIDMNEWKLFTLEEVTKMVGFDVLEALRSNKPLWDIITANQKLIMSVPNRRPVLR